MGWDLGFCLRITDLELTSTLSLKLVKNIYNYNIILKYLYDIYILIFIMYIYTDVPNIRTE